MRKNGVVIVGAVGIAWMLAACGGDPKVVPATPEGANSGSGIFSEGANGTQPDPGAIEPAVEKDLHTVVALEALPTEKYVYVRVKEGENEFWIATTKQDVAIGKTYFYRGGLLKTDFHSTEYSRTFDKLYLISQLVPADHGSSGAAMNADQPFTPEQAMQAAGTSSAEMVEIGDLLTRRKSFEGKSVRVHGICTKVNPNIMGRNWIHLKKDSGDLKEIVVTTNIPIQEGQEVTMAGTVVLDKDFGSGYKYDVMLEGGVLVK